MHQVRELVSWDDFFAVRVQFGNMLQFHGQCFESRHGDVFENAFFGGCDVDDAANVVPLVGDDVHVLLKHRPLPTFEDLCEHTTAINKKRPVMPKGGLFFPARLNTPLMAPSVMPAVASLM